MTPKTQPRPCHPERAKRVELRSSARCNRAGSRAKRSFTYYVYILTNKTDTVIYIGVTNDLRRRLYEHKNEQIEGFTKKYHVHKLVYFEEYSEVNDAIAREKQLKRWARSKKNWLVETKNPNWDDWGEGFFWKSETFYFYNPHFLTILSPFALLTHVESVVCLTRK